MKKIFYSILFLLASLFTNAQGTNFRWAKSIGTIGLNYTERMAVDLNGNIYITGSIGGADSDFDPSPAVNYVYGFGYYDSFLAKYDSLGNYLWSVSIGGENRDHGHDVAVDNLGNVYVTGEFQYDTIDFDPSGNVANLINPTIATRIFLAKYDSNGNYVWAHMIGNSWDDNAYDIEIDTSGYLYLTGYFQETLDFDPSPSIAFLFADDSGSFLAKYDLDGNYIWAKAYASNVGCYSYGFSAALDGMGNIYTTGRFGGTADFNPSTGVSNLTAVNNSNMYVAKFDTSGNYIWAVDFVGTSYHNLRIECDNNGFPIVARSGFIAKFNTNGANLWSKTVSNITTVFASLAIDDQDNIYVTGAFENTFDFNPGPGVANLVSNNIVDAFVAKYDSNGNYIWVKKIWGNDEDQGSDVVIDNFNRLHVTGYIESDTLFFGNTNSNDTLSNSSLSNEIFIAKYGGCTNSYGIDVQTSCNSFTWIDGITYTSSTNSPTHNFVNFAASGCDSIVTLNLTILNSAQYIDNYSVCDSLVWLDGNTYYTNNNSATITYPGASSNGCDSIVTLNLIVSPPNINVTVNNITLNSSAISSTYQWIDCNSLMPVSGATNASFTPTVNGNYAVIVNNGICSDTSACFPITQVGITENTNENISIHPNPTNSTFTISGIAINEISSIEILDITGKLLFKTNSPINIDLSNYENGVYLFRIIGEKNYTGKIVKE